MWFGTIWAEEIPLVWWSSLVKTLSESMLDNINLLLDLWMVVCILTFVAYAVGSELSKRRRRRVLLSETFPSAKLTGEAISTELNKKTDGNSTSASTVISQQSDGTLSVTSSSDLREAESFPGDAKQRSNSLSKQNPFEMTTKPTVGLAATSQAARRLPVTTFSSSNDSSLKPPPKVLFKPIVRHSSVNSSPDDRGEEQESTLPKASVVSTPLLLAQPTSPSSPPISNQPPKRNSTLFLPFIGKRVLNRELSNVSVASVPSILRTNSNLTVRSPMGSPATVDGQPRISPPQSPSPSLSPLISGGSQTWQYRGGMRSSSPGSSVRGSGSSPTREHRLSQDQSSIALDRNECSVCFKLLFKEPVSVCATEDGFPTCLHIYHDRCLRALRRRTCILCGARFRYRRRIPDVEVDPKGWFDTVDVDQSGGLSPSEISRILAAQLPIDRKALEKLMRKQWTRWDMDKSGEVDKDEFFRPHKGLLAYLKRKRNMFKLVEPELILPDIREDPKAWFEYFDNNRNGSLDKSEVLRGLIISFELSRNENICINLRMVLDAVWPIFDSDNNGTITKQEFLEPKCGLATSLVTSLEHRSNSRRY